MLTDSLSPGTFVTTQQAAKLLGVSVRTVQLWVENGVLQAWKTAGGHRRIPRASVDGLREQQREVIQTVTGLAVLRVVVVEADAMRAELYPLKFQSWQLPATVTVVADSFEALLAVGRTKPHVLITSFERSEADGLRLLNALCRHAPEVQPIVTVDADALDRAAAELPEHIAVLPRPIDWDRLAALLRRQPGATRAT
jgi:excisionase family DNA binding protein